MIRTQVSLDEHEYELAKAQAQSLGISVAEFVRRAVREALPFRGEGPWMRFAGFVETGNSESGHSIDEIVYGQKDDCYVDTSAFLAFLDRSDSFHALFRRLFSEPPPLTTSSLVVAEGHGWFLRRYDQHRAIQFLAFIDALPDLTIQGFDAGELRKTGPIFKKFGDHKLTLADAHGPAVMRELRIGRCWSTDRHPGLGGVPLII